jgi:GH24 family phage-related lysozyme (muramidase)
MDPLTALAQYIVQPAYADPTESYYPTAGQQTMSNEGFSPTPYKDTKGVSHIGYGFNLDAHPELPRVMSKESALPYFNKFFKEADSRAMKFAGKRWRQITDSQRAVLADMAYNLQGKLSGFEDMRANLMSGNDQGVQNDMVDSNWYRQVKSRGVRNVKNWAK